MTEYAIVFDIPDGEPFFAGVYKDAAGFAPTLETAMRFESEDAAATMLANAYGPVMKLHGSVVEIGAGS